MKELSEDLTAAGSWTSSAVSEVLRATLKERAVNATSVTALTAFAG